MPRLGGEAASVQRPFVRYAEEEDLDVGRR